MHAPLMIQASVLYDFYVQVFVRAGVPQEDAHRAAAVRLESALRQPAGFDAFNIMRLRNTVRRLQSGGINPTPRLRTVQERPTFALLDGDNGLGAVVGTQPFGGSGLSGTGPKAGGPNYVRRFASEQAVAINTAASGGNASLLAASDE